MILYLDIHLVCSEEQGFGNLLFIICDLFKMLSVSKVLIQHLPCGTEENHKIPQDTWSPDQDLNPGPVNYETGVLTTQP
jgi:hypothetical protein